MKVIRNIDVLGDAYLQERLYRWSIIVFFGGIVLAVIVGIFTLPYGTESLLDPLWWVAAIAGSIVPVPIHELVHGAAFKLLCPGCHVSFGKEDAFLYTSTDGAVLTRKRMVCVLLAPAVLVTAALVAIALAADCPVLAVVLATMHLSGCVGDILMAYEILAEPACTHVRDTDNGIELLAECESEEVLS